MNENKQVWIDDRNRILSFHRTGHSYLFSEQRDRFWQRVMELVNCGYRVQ